MGAKAQYKHKVSFKIGNFSFFFLSFWLVAGKKQQKKKQNDEGREEKGVRERERTKERKKV